MQNKLNTIIRRYWVVVCTFSLICTLILSNQPCNALTVKDVPNPRQQNGGWVTDMVDMLSPQAETQLNQMISNIEKQNGTEIAIVTVPETKPSPTPKAFTTELFNTWGIGKKGKDNGVLFLISKGDRRTEIETGYGIEGILPDAKVVNILRKQVTPQFKEGNFEAGIIAGTKALIQELGTDIQQPQTAIDSGAKNSEINSQKPNNEVSPQSRNTNPFIYLLLVLIGLPVWRFIVLPLTRFIFQNFASSSAKTDSSSRNYGSYRSNPSSSSTSSSTSSYKSNPSSTSTSSSTSSYRSNPSSSSTSSSTSSYKSNPSSSSRSSSSSSSWDSSSSSSSSSDFGGGDSGGGGGDDW